MPGRKTSRVKRDRTVPGLTIGAVHRKRLVATNTAVTVDSSVVHGTGRRVHYPLHEAASGLESVQAFGPWQLPCPLDV